MAFGLSLCIHLKYRERRCQTAYKPGSVLTLRPWTAIPLGRPLPGASRDRPGRRRWNPPAGLKPACRPYLVLLPVGFAVPPPLPGVRCALTAPFHPCLPPEGGRRSVFCGTFPGVAPAGRYPAPCSRGARTFLHPGRLAPNSDRPAVWRELGRLGGAPGQCGGQRSRLFICSAIYAFRPVMPLEGAHDRAGLSVRLSRRGDFIAERGQRALRSRHVR